MVSIDHLWHSSIRVIRVKSFIQSIRLSTLIRPILKLQLTWSGRLPQPTFVGLRLSSVYSTLSVVNNLPSWFYVRVIFQELKAI